jgi:hypothetical protein
VNALLLIKRWFLEQFTFNPLYFFCSRNR